MKNTLEHKARFYCQYHGQRVLKVDNSGLIYTVEMLKAKSDNNSPACSESSWLELTSFQDITDEDAIEVARILDWEDGGNPKEWVSALFNETAGYYIDGYTGDQILEVIDYLRSKSIALPWMGLSVEKQIEYGWIKIKEIKP